MTSWHALGFVSTSAGLRVPRIFLTMILLSLTASCSHRYLTSMWRTLPRPMRDAIDLAAEESTHSLISASHPRSRMMDCSPNASAAARTMA